MPHSQKLACQLIPAHQEPFEYTGEALSIGNEPLSWSCSRLPSLAYSPAYQSYTIRAQIAEALALAAELKDDIREVYKHSGRFPADNRAAGLPLAKHLIGNYVEAIDVDNGVLHIRLGNKANKLIAGKILTLQPLIVAENPTSPISWNCGNSEPPKGMKAVGENRTDVDRQFLPYACRGA